MSKKYDKQVAYKATFKDKDTGEKLISFNGSYAIIVNRVPDASDVELRVLGTRGSINEAVTMALAMIDSLADYMVRTGITYETCLDFEKDSHNDYLATRYYYMMPIMEVLDEVNKERK